MVSLLALGVQIILSGALFALVAVGFTLIFGVGGVLNLAHGASLAVGAFAAFYTASSLSIAAGTPSVLFVVLAAVVVPAIFGGLLYTILIRRFQDEPILVMILTLVSAVAIESLFVTMEGTTNNRVPLIVEGATSVGTTSVQHTVVIMFVLSWLIIGALFYLVNRTDTGQAILATSMDRKGAFLVGIDSNRINLLLWILAGALAGIAGLFTAYQGGGAVWNMGRTPLVLSFAIVVLGGLGSIKGSIIGAYIIGTVEVLTVRLVDPNLAGLMPLLVLVAVLLVRPEGLFGQGVEV